MAWSDHLRVAVEATLAVYEGRDGRGSDAYNEADICHPMADGKYLATLAVLRRSNLLSMTKFADRANVACARLEESASRFSETGYCWGLGFGWRELPPSEPYLISSAVVARGLWDCQRQGLRLELSAKLLAGAGAGLAAWVRELALPVDSTGITLPAYSPGIREPIYNAAAYANGTLKLISDSEGTSRSGAEIVPALEWIRARRVAGLGWPYSPESPLVDLLHQCYLLNTFADVFGAQAIESEAAEMVGQFAGPGSFSDAIRIVSDRAEADGGHDIAWLRPFGAQQLELLPKPARLWSLGELLVLLSRLGLEGERCDAWLRLARRIAEVILARLAAPDDQEVRYPRHVMHAAHGLAAYLAALRQRAGSDAVRLPGVE